MNFESYAKKIAYYSKDVKKKNVQKRLQVENTEMKMTRVKKVQFASLSDKRYCFSDGIFSLPFRHPCCQIYKN